MSLLEIENKNTAQVPQGFQKLRQDAGKGDGVYMLGLDFLDRASQLLDNYDIAVNGVIRTPVDRVPDTMNLKTEGFERLGELSDVTVVVCFTWNRHAGFLREICGYSNVRAIYILEGADYMYRMKFVPENQLFRHPKLQFVDNYYKGVLSRGLTYDYFVKHLPEFELTYQWLADDLSRATMSAFLDGHINLTTFPMEDVKDASPQYFARDIMKLSSEETFIDCGGYDGDTIKELVCQTGEKFRKIYTLEPDTKMLPQLRENIKHLDNCVVLNKGAYSQTGVIGFDNDGCGKITSGSASNTIETVKLDDAIQDEVTFIKMDIEGRS